jgi:hypothetical protein
MTLATGAVAWLLASTVVTPQHAQMPQATGRVQRHPGQASFTTCPWLHRRSDGELAVALKTL